MKKIKRLVYLKLARRLSRGSAERGAQHHQ